MKTPKLKAPFPWFGGKSRVSHLVWPAFGDVGHFIEPFAGSLAMLLGRPTEPRIETVNDLDGYVANFWRAVQADPEAVARFADWPVNEVDLEARHRWLVRQPEKSAFLERMKHDPEHFDAKRAGWWAWGICAWIGSGWCAGEYFPDAPGSHGRGTCDGANNKPKLGNLMGVHRKRPHLGNGGCGVHRKRPHLGNAGGSMGVHRDTPLVPWMLALAARLRRVRVCCGDWERICTDGAMAHGDPVAVFLDPPYSHDLRDDTCYNTDATDVAARCLAWCLDREREGFRTPGGTLRIALCGYEGEHDLPGWRKVAWKTKGGYGMQGDGRARANQTMERIWFSPTCIDPEQASLFGETQ